MEVQIFGVRKDAETRKALRFFADRGERHRVGLGQLRVDGLLQPELELPKGIVRTGRGFVEFGAFVAFPEVGKGSRHGAKGMGLVGGGAIFGTPKAPRRNRMSGAAVHGTLLHPVYNGTRG